MQRTISLKVDKRFLKKFNEAFEYLKNSNEDYSKSDFEVITRIDHFYISIQYIDAHLLELYKSDLYKLISKYESSIIFA